MKTIKINNVKVVASKNPDNKPYKYNYLFPVPFPNIFIIGPTGSGKSELAKAMICEVITDKTILRLFSTTMDADFTTSKLIEKLKKSGIEVEKYEDLALDQLKTQLLEIKTLLKNPDFTDLLKKFKTLFPLVIYFWDDFREKFNAHPEITNLFTKNRHYRAINIVSTQRYKDLPTVARKNGNIHILILTKYLPEVVLKEIHSE